MSSPDALPWIGAPATRALERVGVTSLRQLAGYPRAELAATHGISPKPAGSDCDAAGEYTPTLMPGEEFSVCVTVTVRIPLLPEFVDANTATGQFLVERDRYVDA